MKLETIVTGKGKALLFLGGANTTYAYYKKFIELLSKSYKVYFFHCPGFCNSEAPSSHCTEVYLEAVAQVVKENKLSNYYLAGASFGGWLALEYANTHPKGIRALILFSPMTQVYTRSKVRNVFKLAYLQLTEHAKQDEVLVESVLSPKMYRNAREKYRHSHFVLAQSLNPKHIPDLPILLVVGDRDQIVDTNYTISLFGKYKNAVIHTIPNGNHSAFAMIGNEITNILSNFTQQLHN